MQEPNTYFIKPMRAPYSLILILLLFSCENNIESQNFVVEGRLYEGDEYASAQITHDPAADTAPRIEMISGNDIFKLDSQSIHFKTRQGLPFDENYYLTSILDDSELFVAGGLMFSAITEPTSAGSNWASDYVGRVKTIRLGFDDFSSAGGSSPNDVVTNYSHPSKTFLYRIEDDDPKVPAKNVAESTFCGIDDCITTGQIDSLLFFRMNRQLDTILASLPDVIVGTGISSRQMYLIPHVNVTINDKKYSGFGYVFVARFTYNPLLMQNYLVFPSFILFTPNTDGSAYDVVFIPPEPQNDELRISNKLQVLTDGPFPITDEEHLWEELVFQIAEIPKSKLIVRGLEFESFLNLVFNLNPREKPIPNNFEIIAKMTDMHTESSLIFNRLGRQGSYDLFFLEN